MTRKQEKLLVQYFKWAFEVTEFVNEQQVSFILNAIAWGVVFEGDEFKLEMGKRTQCRNEKGRDK